MSSWPFHVAVYDAINAALPSPVYDAVPDNATYPYTVLDTQNASDAQLLSKQRERIRIYLSHWSETQGQQEVLGMMRTVKDAIQNRKLTLTTGQTIGLVVVSGTTQRDIAAETYTGLQTIEAIVNT